MNSEGSSHSLMKEYSWYFPGGLRKNMRGFRIADVSAGIRNGSLLNTTIKQYYNGILNSVSTK